MADEPENPLASGEKDKEEKATISVSDLSKYIDKMRNALNSRCDSLQSQLSTMKNTTESEIEDINSRIDRIRKYIEDCVTMITNLDEAMDKLLREIQRIDQRGDTNSESIQINRKNLHAVLKYAKSVSTSLNALKEEFADLKEVKEDFGKFRWKFTAGLSTAAAVVGWLLAEDHIYNLIELIKAKFGW